MPLLKGDATHPKISSAFDTEINLGNFETFTRSQVLNIISSFICMIKVS